MTTIQKILDKVLPAYLDSKRRYMCTSLKDAWLAGEITWEECKFATQEIGTYLNHLEPYRTLEMALHDAGIDSSERNREQIYLNWAERPMTSPTLEQKWITKALIYGLGIWEGLKTAEDAGDLTRIQVDLVKSTIYEFIGWHGREPSINEYKNWGGLS